jgi:hypothetical protein
MHIPNVLPHPPAAFHNKLHLITTVHQRTYPSKPPHVKYYSTIYNAFKILSKKLIDHPTPMSEKIVLNEPPCFPKEPPHLLSMRHKHCQGPQRVTK